MKRLILVSIAVCFCIILTAQDIIIMKNYETIEANVEEINNDVIIYHSTKSNDGPVFKISVNKVAKIKFANGEEVSFSSVKETTMPMRGGQILTFSRGNVYQSDIKLTPQDLQQTLPADLYRSFNIGRRLRGHGKRMLICGGALTGASIVLCGAGLGLLANGYYDDASGMLVFGELALIGGAPVLIAGVPLFIIGKNKMNNAINAYNRDYCQEVAFNFGATTNGIGLCITF